MNWQERIYKWFVDDDPKWDPDRVPEVTCSVDDEEVDCFTLGLPDKGFVYNKSHDWWQRTWTAPTPTGVLTCLEVYVKKDGEWKSVMYGDSGDIFYEEPVEEEKIGLTN